MEDIVNQVLNNTPEKKDTLASLKALSVAVTERARQRIDFAKPLLTRFGNGIIYPNTINVVQGKSGVHKSRLVEVILSSLLSPSSKDEHLDFRRSADYKIYGVLADTERNLNEQLPYALQQLKRLTNTTLEDDIQNFTPITLIKIDRTDRFDVLKHFLDDLRKRVKDHLFIVLDVVTDCVENFNDPKSSMKLIDLMNSYINEYNLTFLCVIHENPNSNDKARGHLGTELNNKSSTVLQIGFESKESELIKVKYLKCRKSKRFDPIYMMYSEEAKGLVLADQQQVLTAKESRQVKASISKVKNKIKEVLLSPMQKNDLVVLLTTQFNCGTRTIEERLKEILETKQLFTDEQNDTFYLERYKEGRTVFFRLTKNIT